MSSLNQCRKQPQLTHHFHLNTITYSVRSHVSQFRLNVCTQIKTSSTNGRKRIAWDDVTKHFLFHKAAILTNSLESFKHWNVEHVNNISSTYIVSALLWEQTK